MKLEGLEGGIGQRVTVSGPMSLWVNLGSEPQSLHYCQGYIFCGTGERNRGYAQPTTANKSETVLYRAPTFSLLLVSHGGISSCRMVNVSKFL